MSSLEEEVAIITNEDSKEMVENDPKPQEEEEEEEIEEEEYDSDEYIEASRYSFELKKDHFIFDFKDVDPESDDEGNEMEEENDENDENEEEEEEDGMEEEGNVDDNMTEQQRVFIMKFLQLQEQVENEAREAVQKNVTRRMGWFDMIRRLEKKVTNGLLFILVIIQKNEWLKVEVMIYQILLLMMEIQLVNQLQ